MDGCRRESRESMRDGAEATEREQQSGSNRAEATERGSGPPTWARSAVLFVLGGGGPAGGRQIAESMRERERERPFGFERRRKRESVRRSVVAPLARPGREGRRPGRGGGPCVAANARLSRSENDGAGAGPLPRKENRESMRDGAGAGARGRMPAVGACARPHARERRLTHYFTHSLFIQRRCTRGDDANKRVCVQSVDQCSCGFISTWPVPNWQPSPSRQPH
eukprot:357339-Chlamydomonas_euryale.AAC.4